MSAPHRLLIVTRRVPRQQAAAYARGWERVRAAATKAGAHAWRFRAASPAESDAHLEFLEWSSELPDPTQDPALADALEGLARSFPGDARRWDELAADFPQEGTP